MSGLTSLFNAAVSLTYSTMQVLAVLIRGQRFDFADLIG